VEAFGAVHIAVNCAGVADAAKTVSKGEPFPLATWNKVLGIKPHRHHQHHPLRGAGDDPQRARGRERSSAVVIVNTASGAACAGADGAGGLQRQQGRRHRPDDAGGARPGAIRHPRGVDRAGPVRYRPGGPDAAEGCTQSFVDRVILYPKPDGAAEEFANLVRHIAENAYLNATTIDIVCRRANAGALNPCDQRRHGNGRPQPSAACALRVHRGRRNPGENRRMTSRMIERI